MRLWGDELLLHSPMPVQWYRPRGGRWARLDAIDLEDPQIAEAAGVYVIWRLGSKPRVLRVGQGAIRSAIVAARRDPRLRRQATHDVRVTWAAVAGAYRDGVVAYLSDYYEPELSAPVPEVDPIPVDLP
jgi:hypothetical protein